jgi:4'-phosphopantetheinyl transferase
MRQSHWRTGPAKPRLADEAVDVWLVALDDEQPGAVLDARERERAARFVRDEDGSRWIAARAALRQLLALYVDADPRALRFGEGTHGKPELTVREGARASELRFNLSHSGELALIAVAREREVGVDVELPRRAVDHVAIARRVLTAAEADRIAAIADPLERERAFLQAWVRWEAVLKCRGTGIGGAVTPSSGPEPWVLDLDVPAPAAAALAVADGPATVRTWRRPPAER